MMTEKDERPTFLLHLRPEPHVADPFRALRGLLKAALRRFGLRCTGCEISTQTAAAFQKLRDDVAERTGSPPARARSRRR
jgi:hypothetical protein